MCSAEVLRTPFPLPLCRWLLSKARSRAPIFLSLGLYSSSFSLLSTHLDSPRSLLPVLSLPFPLSSPPYPLHSFSLILLGLGCPSPFQSFSVGEPGAL